MSYNIVPALVALVMMFTGICGAFGGAGTQEPVSVEFGVDLDGDVSSLIPDMDRAQAAVVQQLLKVMTLRIALDGSCGQLDVKLAGTPVASMSARAGEDSWSVVSDLFPTVLLTVPKLAQDSASAPDPGQLFGNSLMPKLPDGVDPVALLVAARSSMEEIRAGFVSRFGEEEAGSFTVDGRDYTRKAVCDITLREAAELVIPAVKKLLSDQAFAPLQSLLGDDFSPDALDGALKSIREAADGDLPVLSVVKYGAEGSDSCTDIRLEKDSQYIRFAAASAGGAAEIRANVYMDEKDHIDAVLAVDILAGRFSLESALTVSGRSVALSGVLESGENGGTLTVDATFPVHGSPEPVSARLTAVYSKEAPVFAAGDGLETVSVKSLLEDEKEAARFNIRLLPGFMKLLAKIARVCPDVMDLLVQDSDKEPAADGDAVVVEESPADDTPAEETPVEELPVEMVPSDGTSAA